MDVITVLGVASLGFVAAVTWNESRRAPGVGQSPRSAMLEAWINIAIGFSVNYAANLLLLPLVGAQLTAANNFWLGCTYTAISIVRQYVIRRHFNARLHAVKKP
jgi:hypothetical protein